MINVHEVVETNGLVFDCVTDEHSITIHDKAMKAACDSAYDDEVAAARRPPSDEHRVRHIATDAFGSITGLRPNGVMAMSPQADSRARRAFIDSGRSVAPIGSRSEIRSKLWNRTSSTGAKSIWTSTTPKRKKPWCFHETTTATARILLAATAMPIRLDAPARMAPDGLCRYHCLTAAANCASYMALSVPDRVILAEPSGLRTTGTSEPGRGGLPDISDL